MDSTVLDSASPGAAVGFLALAPVLVFTLARSGVGGISADNVVIVFAALHLAPSPLDSGRERSGNGSSIS